MRIIDVRRNNLELLKCEHPLDLEPEVELVVVRAEHEVARTDGAETSVIHAVLEEKQEMVSRGGNLEAE